MLTDIKNKPHVFHLYDFIHYTLYNDTIQPQAYVYSVMFEITLHTYIPYGMMQVSNVSSYDSLEFLPISHF